MGNLKLEASCNSKVTAVVLDVVSSLEQTKTSIFSMQLQIWQIPFSSFLSPRHRLVLLFLVMNVHRKSQSQSNPSRMTNGLEPSGMKCGSPNQ